MADGNLPDIETLRKLLAYDPETGALTWKPRPAGMFKAGRRQSNAAAIWNARFAGRQALTCSKDGYLSGSIFASKVRAHRVAWALFHGEWPSDQIDHKNGDRSDNRINNLRDVSCHENMKNQKRRSDNSSGVVGVRWHRQRKKWNARIRVLGAEKSLGMFSDFDSAVSARKAAEREFEFHENHGRPA